MLIKNSRIRGEEIYHEYTNKVYIITDYFKHNNL